MANTFTIIVPDITATFAAYDQVKVYRADTKNGTYAEVSGTGTRPELVEGEPIYEFIDAAGTSAHYYKTSFFDPSGPTESELSAPRRADNRTYISADDIRDLDIDDTIISDEALAELIIGSQQMLERATKQWFSPRLLEFGFDGNDADTIHIAVPIISIEWLRLNGSTENAEVDFFHAYVARSFPDDRRNPRIALERQGTDDIYSASRLSGQLKFRKGRQNQRVRGKFGFVEEDGSTPAAIVRALTKIVVQNATTPIYAPPGSSSSPPLIIAGVVVEETTDGHSIKYSDRAMAPTRPGLSGITNDQEILDIFKLYRAPLGIGAPADWSYYK